MKKLALSILVLCCLCPVVFAGGKKADFHPEEYVSTLVGTLSDPRLQADASAQPLDQRLRLLQRDAGA